MDEEPDEVELATDEVELVADEVELTTEELGETTDELEELDEETTELEEPKTADELTGVEDEELVVVDAGTELEELTMLKDEVDDTTEELEETLGTRYAPLCQYSIPDFQPQASCNMRRPRNPRHVLAFRSGVAKSQTCFKGVGVSHGQIITTTADETFNLVA